MKQICISEFLPISKITHNKLNTQINMDKKEFYQENNIYRFWGTNQMKSKQNIINIHRSILFPKQKKS